MMHGIVTPNLCTVEKLITPTYQKEIMRLTNVSVNNLFGIFDHNIPLNGDSGITIIIGENGLGKTVILESIHYFFTKNFSFFRKLEFKYFKFSFSNGEIWEISRRVEGNSIGLYVVRWFEYKEDRSKPYKFYEASILEENDDASSYSNKHRIDKYRDLIEEGGLQPDHRLRDFMLYEYMMNKDRGRIYEREVTGKKIPTWFNDVINKVEVKIIETQRIMTAKERGGDAYVRTVQKFSNELVEKISKLSKESAEISVALDSTYPNRLMQKLRQREIDSYDELNQALSKLDERRKLLSSTGLIENQAGSDLLQINNSDTSLFNPLKLYIDDSNKKLSPYDEMAKKISLFKWILNRRFKHKNIEIHRSKGFVFRSSVPQGATAVLPEIPPQKLSSGEQNELVMFYDLIFNSKEGDTMLIDEPELSLHISWQNKFISDLKYVTSMNNVSIVIATHSPDIIADNWDLKVELLGVE